MNASWPAVIIDDEIDSNKGFDFQSVDMRNSACISSVFSRHHSTPAGHEPQFRKRSQREWIYSSIYGSVIHTAVLGRSSRSPDTQCNPRVSRLYNTLGRSHSINTHTQINKREKTFEYFYLTCRRLWLLSMDYAPLEDTAVNLSYAASEVFFISLE